MTILSSLTSWWAFDGDMTDSHGANDIVSGLTVAGYGTGKQGQALSKDSMGYAVLTTPITVDANTALTIGGWFYFDGAFTSASIFSVGYDPVGGGTNEAHSLLTGAAGQWVSSSWADWSNNYVVADSSYGGLKYNFTVRCGDSIGQHATSDQSITIRSASGNLPGWYFAVTVWEGVYLKLYVNGDLVATSTPPRPTPRAAQIKNVQVGNQIGALTPCACDELFFCGATALSAA